MKRSSPVQHRAAKTGHFLILNKEIFFACDAKYKNYSKGVHGIQAWYTDLFECGAYKYIYRLNLGNVTMKIRVNVCFQ